MSVVLDREITWFQQLKGNIVDEILAITDGKGRSGWEKLDKNFLWYFVRNCAGFPWANRINPRTLDTYTLNLSFT